MGRSVTRIMFVNVLLLLLLVPSIHCTTDSPDAAEDVPRLIWAERDTTNGRARITSIRADNFCRPDAPGGIDRQYYYQTDDTQFVGMAGDYANRTAFWSATTNRSIFRGGLGEGASAVSMFTGTSRSVEGLAVDWLSKNVYWTDSSYDWIMIADYSATYYTVLIDTDLDKPRGITTFPQRGYLFWTDWGERNMIERATLGGLNRTVIVDTDLYFPNGITVDPETSWLYWVDANTDGNVVERSDINGDGRRHVMGFTAGLAHAFDLVVFSNNVILTDLSKALLCTEKHGGGVAGNSFSRHILQGRPYGIMVYGPGVQPAGPSPCASNPCQHLCTVAPDASFECLCKLGYNKTMNGTSCYRDEDRVAKPQLLVVTRNEITRFPGNLADLPLSQVSKTRYLVSNRTLLVALDVDTKAEFLFFSDFGKREIYRVRLLSGRSIKTIAGGLGSAEGLAVDWLNQNLYWTDAIRRHIAVSRYDGSRRKFLLEDNIIRPRSLVIHADQRLMFWTEFGPPVEIERANLDGTGRMVIKSGLDSPNGLAIDFKRDRLYYATRGNGVIESINFDGTQPTNVYRKSGAKYFGLELYRDYLYFTEWGSDNGLHGINLNTNELVSNLPLQKTVYGLRMYDDTRQPDGISVCDEDTCDHLCLPKTPEGFVCHCSIGFTLDADNVTCNVDIMMDNFVLVADTHIPGIFQISLEGSMDRFTALPLEEMVRPIALAYDPVDTRVYWTDVRLGSFSRAFLNGSGQETLGRSGIDGPDGLTIDPISRLLFWTDVARNTITVSSLDGTQIKTLIDDELDQPRAIVLDPVGGYMYYSDWGVVPKIEKAHMDGTRRQVLVDTDIAWPNGLALDIEEGKLYWGDAKIDHIERINLDGTDRELLVDLSPRGHPYGVAIFGPYVYWSDWKIYGLMRAPKNNGSNPEKVGPQTFTRISEIHVYNSTRELSGTNACTTNNGGCSHLCLPTPTGRTCACPDGIALDNTTNAMCLTTNLTCNSSVPYGRLLMDDCSLQPGRRCTVECDPGYWTVSKEYDILCMASGQWEVDLDDFCTVVECPRLNVSDHVLVASCADPPLQNSTCSHECELGYKWSSGNADLTCEKDGTWSGPQLQCVEITCPVLENPPHGMYFPRNCTFVGGRYDDECTLFCQDGFTFQGSITKSCQEDGHWSDEGLESVCVDLTPPDFGQRCPPDQSLTADRGETSVLLELTNPEASDFTEVQYVRSHDLPSRFNEGENEVAIIARDEANNTAVCEFTVNVTVMYCDYLSTPLSGMVSGNCTYNYGSVCHFACNPGYRLVGSNTRTCEWDGTPTSEPAWEGDKAVCEAILCPQPRHDGEKVYQSGCAAPYGEGVECTYMCAPGYFQVNGTALRICQENGVWTGDEFYCHVKVCDPIPAFEHGIIEPEDCSISGGTVNNVCRLSCTEGYRYQGMAEHTCLERGEWSNLDDSHICEDATAPHFDTCPDDFTVTAPPLMRQANATWEIPQAVDIHSQIWNLTSSHQPGVTLPEGTHAIVVTATDSVGNVATCRFYVTVRVIYCPEEIMLPNNAHWADGGWCDTVLGSACTLECRTGHTLSGAAVRKCVWDGQSETGTWELEGNESVCQIVTCPPLESSNLVHYACSNSLLGSSDRYTYGTACVMTCRSFIGFFPYVEGGTTISCQADGTWSKSLQYCSDQRSSCPDVNMTNPGDRLQFSSGCISAEASTGLRRCEVTCPAGYQITQRAYFMCRRGAWRPRIPNNLACLDQTPPVFDAPCPREVTVTVPPCSVRANVTYAIPMATDNDGEDVIMQGPTDEVLPVELMRGDHNRTYHATDQSGNTATCVISINVRAPLCVIEPEWRTGSVLAQTMSCRNIYGSRLRFRCADSSARLVGDVERECQSDGQWSGTTPTCEVATCERLPLPPNTYASPPECANATVNALTKCKAICQDGFSQTPNRPLATTCTTNGTWSADITGIQCTDVRPPEFENCPTGMTIPLRPQSSLATVHWTAPVATDNVGVVSTTVPDARPPLELAPGTAIFTYTATDAQGLVGLCSFDITVIDTESPSVMNCPTDVNVVQTNTMPVTVDYEPPIFTDNVGIAHYRSLEWYTRIQWVNSVAYEFGYTEVHHMAVDRAGNMAECNLKFEIVESTECPPLVAPPNSAVTCNADSSLCQLSCNQGYYENGGPSQFTLQCQPSGLWNNSSPRDENPFLPVCSRQITSTLQWTQTAEFAFDINGDCRNSVDLIQSKFAAFFESSNLYKACLAEQGTDCSVTTPAVACYGGDSSPDEPTRRRKRQSSVSSSSSSPSSSSSTALISVTVTTTKEGAAAVPAFFSSFHSTSVDNLWSENNTGLVLPNMTATLDPAGSSLGGFEPSCLTGQIAVDLLCVYCPPGTYQDRLESSCVPCPKGTYQEEQGQLTCIHCGEGKMTRATGAYALAQCQDMCPPGTYSYLGLQPGCLDCSVGTYQEESGQRGCRPCPPNTTTSLPGASTENACIDPADVTSPPPTTTDNDIPEVTSQDSNHAGGVTDSATVRIKPTPSVVITTQPARTDKNNKTSGQRGGRQSSGGHTVLIVAVCIVLIVIVIIVAVVAVVIWRRRRGHIPMMKLTHISLTTPSDEESDDDGAVGGNYRQLQEMDHFDLEHLASYGDEPAAREKRNSFSNALYESEDNPSPVQASGQVWTSFEDATETQA